ncbi:hypothetical protein [Actinoplanes sp. NPDC051859]|uniref:hypothetical protein n=1 Tax=Actinoplanes sp. NPDC051859 TaxID=3363909 RepID=UPI0037B4189B
MPDAPAPADELRTATQRLLAQVGHWESGRWSTSVGEGSRGDLVFALVQRLADLAADAERRPRREVPREADTALPDQLRVTIDDLLLAEPTGNVLTQAAADLLAVRKTL